MGLEDLFWEARRFVYVRDGDGDYWQSPWLTEVKQAGDCEDKALWLYTRLKAQGFDNIRLVVGHYRAMDKNLHVWIMHRGDDGITRILDPTLQNRVWKLEQFGTGYYHPAYSYDGQVRYRHLDYAEGLGISCEELPDGHGTITMKLVRAILSWSRLGAVEATIPPLAIRPDFSKRAH